MSDAKLVSAVWVIKNDGPIFLKRVMSLTFSHIVGFGIPKPLAAYPRLNEPLLRIGKQKINFLYE